MLSRLIVVFFTLMFSASIFADSGIPTNTSVVDNSCSQAFEDDGLTIKKFSGQICRQDVALNSLTIAIGSLIYGSNEIMSAFNSFNAPILDVSPEMLKISGPFEAISVAVVNLVSILALFVAGFFIGRAAYTTMRDQSWGTVYKEPDNWVAVGAFSMAVIMLFKLDNVNVGQVVIVYAALGGLTLANILMSSTLSAFTFEADLKSTELAHIYNMPEGESFAIDIIQAISMAKNSALITNNMNSAFEGEIKVRAHGFDNRKISHNSLLDKFVNFVSGRNYKKKEITAVDHLKNLNEGTALTFSQESTVNNNSFVGVVAGNGITKDQADEINRLSSMNNGRAQLFIGVRRGEALHDDIGYKYYFDGHDPEDIFENTTVADISSSVSLSNKDEMNNIISTGVADLIKLYETPTDGDINLRDLSRSVRGFVDKNISEGTSKRDFANAMHTTALGLISNDFKTGNNGSFKPTTHYLKVGMDNEDVRIKGILGKILKDALTASNYMQLYHCTKNAADPNIFADFIAVEQFNDDGGGGLAADVFKDNTSFFGQCIKSKNGESPELMVSDETKANMEEAYTYIKSGELDIDEAMQLMEMSFEQRAEDAQEFLEEARKIVKKIGTYHARVSTILSHVLAEGEVEAVNGEDVIRNIRLQGPMSISSYFAQLSSLQSRVIEAMSSSVSPVKINLIGDQDNSSGVLSSNFLRSYEVGERITYYTPFGGDLKIPLREDGFFGNKTTSDSAVSTDGVKDSDFSWLLDLMIPGDNVLKQGFGFDTDKSLVNNYEDCSTTTNCVKFTQHPLATMSLFGKELVLKSIYIIIVNQIISAIAGIDIQSIIDSLSSDFGSFLGKDVQKAFSSFLSKIVGGTYKLVIGSLAVISGVAAKIATILLLAGLVLAYVLPFMPFLTQLFLWLGWVAEVLILFAVSPLLYVLMLWKKDDGSSVVSGSTILSMHASVILRAPLIVVSFIMFWTMSYVAIYAANSIIFAVMESDLTSGSLLIRMISYVVMFTFIALSYFVCFKMLNDLMSKMPDFVLKHINISGLNNATSAGFEQFIQTREMHNFISGAAAKTGHATGKGVNSAVNKAMKRAEKKNADNKS